jgi:hypothetical protein
MKINYPGIACLLLSVMLQPVPGMAAAHDPWIGQAFQEILGRAPTGSEWNISNYGGGHWSSYADLVEKVKAKMTDPWIGKAYQEALGRAPRGAEWNTGNYGGGNWSSYNDLLNKIRVKMTGQGAVYIFIKPEQAVYQGHIGWGFVMDDGRYCYGSTENPMKGAKNFGQGTRAVWDAININEGSDNGYWYGYADTEQQMLDDMKRVGGDRQYAGDYRYPEGFRCSGYWHYKTSMVLTRHVQSARDAGTHCQKTGFKGVGWNCLDQTYSILEAYGTDTKAVMPWKWDHPSPNYWFNDFGSVDSKTHRASKGGNTTGTAL